MLISFGAGALPSSLTTPFTDPAPAAAAACGFAEFDSVFASGFASSFFGSSFFGSSFLGAGSSVLAAGLGVSTGLGVSAGFAAGVAVAVGEAGDPPGAPGAVG